MVTVSEKWPVVAKVAESLGVSDWAIYKWKQRGAVPPRWHLPLIAASNGELSANDFMPIAEAAE